MSPLRLIPVVFLPLLIGALSALSGAPEQASGPATAQVSPAPAVRLVAVQDASASPRPATPAQAAEGRIIPFVGSNVPEMGR